jgi:hypothetical protein
MLKVQVSPFLGVSEWVDPHSGITFSKSAGVIDIPDGTNLTGIKKHIRLNQLIFVGGTFVEAPVKIVVDTPPVEETPVTETPVVEKSVEEPVVTEEAIETKAEAEVAEVAEAPKPEKKSPAKKKSK